MNFNQKKFVEKHLLSQKNSVTCSLIWKSTGTGGGWVDEIQNKAEAQPAWLQLAAGAGSWGWQLGLNWAWQYQPSGVGGTRSPPASLYCLQHLTARFIQNCRRGPEIGQTFGPSNQLSLNKIFDSIIPSMRTSKIQNGHQGASKWPTGSGKWSTPRFLGAPVNFR